ncbi:fibronectin type III domain-containing protein [Nonomuraea sp. NPDC050328]|uniref:fibronectin type III domain-containing protein n=1 Tax=Nonomuraea sp. NPDC050328 TaxID=3364361 RepID=UPI0037BE0370
MFLALLLTSLTVTGGTPAAADPGCKEGDPRPICDPYPEPPGSHDPEGSLTAVERKPSGLHVTGTAHDPSDPTKQVTVDITVDGAAAGSVIGNQSQSQRFAGVVPALAGSKVCAQVRNIGAGASKSIGCVNKTIKVDPFGAWESSTRENGKIRVKGWVLDPDSTDPVQVDVYDRKGFLGSFMANKSRPDAMAAYPEYGTLHGFDALMPENETDGENHVCLVVINKGPGTFGDWGCYAYPVKHLPWGAVDKVERTGKDLKVTGWAVDDDAKTSPVTVDVYNDGVLVHTAVANQHRPTQPEYGDAHGFELTIPNAATIETGQHAVCVKGRNLAAGVGADKEIGCKNYTVKPPVTPPQYVDSERTDTTITFHWAGDANADGWARYWKKKDDTEWTYYGRGTASPLAQYRTFGGLEPGTMYCLRLVAFNDRPSEAPSEWCEKTYRPSLPMATDLKVIGTSDTSLTLQWTDNADVEEFYRVTYAPPGTRATVIQVPARAGTGTMTFTIQGLKPVTDYYVTVAPWNVLHYYTVVTDTRGMTTGKPVIDVFKANWEQIGICDSKDITLTWKVRGAAKLDILKDGAKINTLMPEGADEWWEGTLQAGSSEGDDTYTLVAYSPAGQTSTASFYIRLGSNYALVNKIVYTNMGGYNQFAVLHDRDGNKLQRIGEISPGQVWTYQPPRCEISEVKIYREVPVPPPSPAPGQPTPPPPPPIIQEVWTSQRIVGHDKGSSMPSQGS